MSTYDPPDESKTEILLDKIDALRILRAESDEERDQLLFELAGSGRVEQEMLRDTDAGPRHQMRSAGSLLDQHRR